MDRVIARTEECYQLAEQHFRRRFPRPDIELDLRGQRARFRQALLPLRLQLDAAQIGFFRLAPAQLLQRFEPLVQLFL